MKLVRILPLTFLFFSLIAGFYGLHQLKTITDSTKEDFERNLELMKKSNEQLKDSLK